MSSPSNENDDSNKTASHESGALAAWGMIGGGLVGALIGLCFGRALAGAVLLGSLAWVLGALVDRAKR